MYMTPKKYDEVLVDLKSALDSDLKSIYEIYENLSEKKWIEELVDNIKLKIFDNDISEENIENFKSTIRTITSVYYLMKDKFSKKYRNTWERYFEHLREVANIVLQLPDPSIEKVLIALLHDANEDVWASFEVMSYVSWSEKVALAVIALSKRPWQDYSDDEVEWKKDINEAECKRYRNEEYFEHLISYENMKRYLIEDVLFENNIELNEKEIEEVLKNIFDVKFADRIHNLSTQWDINNLTQVEKKVEETKKYFLDIAQELNPEAYIKLKSLVLELEIKLFNAKEKTKEILEK